MYNMKLIKVGFFLTLFILNSMIGCGLYVTTKNLKKYDITIGSKKVFPYTQEKIIDAVYSALPNTKLELENEEKLENGTHIIYAEAGPFLTRQGEVARICIVPMDNKTEIRILTRKKMPTNNLEKSQQAYASQIFLLVETYLHKTDQTNKYKYIED